MSGFFGIEHREVVRVKVKKYEGYMQPECKKFSLDPQITSFEMLQHIIASAFNIKGDFTMSYLARDDYGQEIYLSMLSDWDMDAAVQSASDPCLQLKVDTKPFEEGLHFDIRVEKSLDDWDIIAPVDVPQYKTTSDRGTLLGSLTGSISSGMGKTLTHMQRAMGIRVEEETKYKVLKSPMTDLEFRNYLDSAGHMIKPEEFRLSIYQGGCEPSLRRVAWRHLLNIFPAGLSGKERFDYMKKKEIEYFDLRDQWKKLIQNGQQSEEIKYVTSMVKKDVLRTDRTHKFYSGSDDNKNLISLFHILVTFALTHPDTSYCQGMSDIASPLLVTQKDEAQAYLCFCALMKRLKNNFNVDGKTITTKFKHISDLLQLHDPVLFSYLQDINAHDLFFCYRWILLELKREFPFDEALYMLEVMWSTLPPDPPENGISLTDSDFSMDQLSMSPHSPSYTMKQTVYAKLFAMRRQRSSVRLASMSKDADTPVEKEIAQESVNNNSRISPSTEIPSSLVTSQEYPKMEDPETRAIIERSSSIDGSLKISYLDKVKNNELLPTIENGDYSKESQKKDLQEGLAQSVLRKNFEKFSVKKISEQNDVTATNEIGSLDEKCRENDKNVNDEAVPMDPHGRGKANSQNSESGSHVLPNQITDDKLPESVWTNEISENNSENDKSQYLDELIFNEADDNKNVDGAVVVEVDKLSKSESNLGEIIVDETEMNNEASEDGQDAMNGSGQSQFYISLEDSQENSLEDHHSEVMKQTSSSTVGDNSQRTGFFSNVKRLLASPRRRPHDIQIHQSASLAEPSSQNKKQIHQDSSESCATDKNEEMGTDSHSADNLSDSGDISENSIEIIQQESDKKAQLLPPDEFGCGNPFLMFLCLTLLLQHRDLILQKQLEYDEIAIMFDRLVRKHNVQKVLHQSRNLYSDYLRTQQKIAELNENDFSV